MQSLDIWEVLQNVAVLVILPLIIWLNVRRSARTNPLHARIWHEYANLMRVSIFMLALLTLFTACALLTDFGLVSPAVEEKAAKYIGIAFLIAAIALVPLGITAAFRTLRGSRQGQSGP